jgi:hypothetical protein
MIKRNGQCRQQAGEPPLRNMTDAEYAAYFEAFGAIKSEYQTLRLICDKLRKIETTAGRAGFIESQTTSEHTELPDSRNSQSPWEICSSLMGLGHNEVLLCKRMAEHGIEYAVIDHSPTASAYAKTNGPLDLLHTGNDPYRVLRDYLRSERQALELMVNDIAANVRVLVAERFPSQDLGRVVNSITRMCKKVARVGFSERTWEYPGQNQSKSHGVRI